ncbi:MAG TPA: ABC transporter permease, partial [Candidatus Eisenbacteria bacterium]|nr:ABC transporter permease [Candidatus Eisenbacteria bacterium]
MQRVEWFIARRYVWSERRHPFVGIISTISVLGIAVGVAALIVVLAVMNGFDEDLKDRIIGLHAHVTVEKEGVFREYPVLMEKLSKARMVRGAAPYIEGQALIQNEEWGSGVLVRGLDPQAERTVSRFHQLLTEGRLSGSPGRAVLGLELAKRAGLKVGSEFKILTQNAEKPSKLTVEGIFSSGMYEFDANLVFLDLKSAQALFGMEGSASGVSLALTDPSRAEEVKAELQRSLGYPYYVRTWMDMNRTLFAALKLEKIVMFLILALIILVACLNIAGSLTILVMDKTKDIGVLMALGATRFQIMKIFALDGLLIGTVGAAAGLALGTGLCFVLKTYPIVELPREIYYINRLPVQMQAFDTGLVAAVAVILSFLSAFYPAVMAGRL